MSRSMTIYLGTVPTLLSHILEQSVKAQNSAVIVVPTRWQQQWLTAQGVLAPVRTGPDLLAQWLPPGTHRWPPGTWHLLEAAMPGDFIPEPYRGTPNISAEVIRTLMVLRRRRYALRDASPWRWATLNHWWETTLPSTLFDDARLYQYAMNLPGVPETFAELWFWGWAASPLARRFATRCAQAVPVRLWSTAQAWGHGWADERPTVVRLNEDGSGGLSAAQAVSVSSRSALYDAPFQLLDGRAGLVVWIGDADPKPWWRALRRYRAEPGLGRSSWRPREWLTFLRVAWGEADRAETLNWLEERVPHERVRLQPAARSLDWPRAVRQVRSADGWWRWALTFYHRIRLATRWSDVVKAVEEALAQLGCQPTPQMARILSTWNDWDGLKPPTPDLVRRLLTLWGGETPEDDTPVSLDLAHWSDQPLSAPEGLLVVVDDGRGRMPGRAERYPLLSGAVRAPRWEKLWLQQLFDTASYAWLVYQEPARWPPRIRRTAAQAFEQAPPASIAAVEWPWHQAWRVDPGHNAWTGRVSPALVGAVLPTDWTATGIERFGRCPLHFFWSEVLAVRPAPGDQPRTVPNDLIGRWAHRVLETMAMTDELTPDSRPAIRQAIDQAVAEASPPPSVMAWHVQAVCQQLAYEIDEVVFRYREALHEAVTGEPERTVQWTVTLDDTTVWPFRGRLDRLDRLPDGSLRIVDYKTGRAVPDPARYAPWSLQLPLYQQAVAEQSGRAVTAEVWGISWRSGFVRRILSAEVAERQRSKLVRLLKGIHARVAQGQFYPLPKPGLNPCRTCEYRPLCPNAIGLWAEKKLRGESLFRALWEDDSEDLGSSGPTQGAGAGD